LHRPFPELSKLKGPKRIKIDFEKIFPDNIENHFPDLKEI
jgi:hypothetical protein